MARPQRNNVDYFPFLCEEGNKMFYLEETYGNDGFATFVKLLRELAKTDFHYLDLSKKTTQMYLSAKCKVTLETLNLIISDLVELGKFDSELWEENNIVWCQDFIDSIQDAYSKRSNNCININSLLHLLQVKGIRKPPKSTPKPPKQPSEVPVKPQSIEEYSIEEETKVKESIENSKPETSENEDFSKDINLDDSNKPLEEKERKKVAIKKEKIDYKEVVEFFNNTCTQLPKVQKLTKKRETSIRKLIEEYGGEKVGEVLTLVSKSEFLNGKSTLGWRSDFDWILKPDNFIKILEGQYKNKEKPNKQDAKFEAQRQAYLANSNPNDLM